MRLNAVWIRIWIKSWKSTFSVVYNRSDTSALSGRHPAQTSIVPWHSSAQQWALPVNTTQTNRGLHIKADDSLI